MFQRFRFKFILILILICSISIGATDCGTKSANQGNNANVSQIKNVKRDILSYIHKIENTLLRLTEMKRQLADKMDKEAMIRISNTLIQINDVVLKANKLVRELDSITPTNKKDVLTLINNGLTLLSDLTADGTFISDSKLGQQFFALVELARTSIFSIQIIMEGIK